MLNLYKTNVNTIIIIKNTCRILIIVIFSIKANKSHANKYLTKEYHYEDKYSQKR